MLYNTHWHLRWRRSNKCGPDLCNKTCSTGGTSGLWSLVFEDASYKWSVDIVEKFCGIPRPDWGGFCDFIHLKGKFSTAVTVRRRAGRPEVAQGGVFRLRTKGSSCDAGRRESRHHRAGFRFCANQRWRSSCGTLRGTYNNRSGSQRRTAGSAN